MFLEIAINSIKTKKNYRKTFDESKLKGLAQSIKRKGVIEPIIVRRNGDGFQLIAGERRVRASELAGRVTIPAIIKDIEESEVLELQLIENVQREGVPYLEEARALLQLRDDHALTAKEIGQKIGKSETYVTYQLKVTEMPPAVLEACEKGELTKTVAWTLARLTNPEWQIKAAKDLRRSERSKLITERTARQYIQDTFSDNPRRKNKGQSKAEKIFGNDFKANWKKHLLGFDCQQFERFKREASGRTETALWADTVDLIMSDVE